VLILLGIICFLIQIHVSIRNRAALRDRSGDPWDGRTLEWSTSSPPPAYNFAFIPRVQDLDAWWEMKRRGYHRPAQGFRAITLPRNTSAGVVLASVSAVLAFAMIWYIWWLAAVSLVALLASAIAHTFDYERERAISAQEVLCTERMRDPPLAARG
jgi:cytochrome o ubiquinol oxidase subunit 1